MGHETGKTATIRSEAVGKLEDAAAAGLVTADERDAVLALWAETDNYKRRPYAKAQPGLSGREQFADLVLKRILL